LLIVYKKIKKPRLYRSFNR